MEGVVFKNEPGALLVGETLLDKGKIQILVAAVYFIADNRVTKVREMDPDLMLAASARQDAKEGKWC